MHRRDRDAKGLGLGAGRAYVMQLPLRHAACPPLALGWVNMLVIRCHVVRAASVWIRARCDVAKVVVRITAVERRLEFRTTQSNRNQNQNQKETARSTINRNAKTKFNRNAAAARKAVCRQRKAASNIGGGGTSCARDAESSRFRTDQ